MKIEALCLNNVCVAKPYISKLRYININLFEGEIIGFIGLKGTGLTSLLEVLKGKVKIDSGNMKLFGKDYSPSNIYDALKLGVLTVNFKSNLIADMTIHENFFIARNKRNLFEIIRERMIERETSHILKEFEIDLDATTLVSQLTEIQCLFIELIRAYILNAKVIILDDVIREYKEETLVKFNQLIDQLIKKGISIIFVGYSYRKIMERLDRIYVVLDGNISRILYKGTYSQIDFYKFMIGKNYMDLIKIDKSVKKTIGNTIYEVKNLVTKNIKNLNFNLKKGEILGLFDYDHYCGTQLSRTLIGEIPIEEGAIIINNKTINNVSCYSIIKEGVGIISYSNDNIIFEGLSIKDNITMPILNKTHRSKQLINNRVLDFALNENKGYLVDIEVDENIINMSQEKKIVVQLIKCIISEAQVIIVEHQILEADFLQLHTINEFILKMANKGCGIIVVASSLEYLKGLCDTIIQIKDGKQ